MTQKSLVRWVERSFLKAEIRRFFSARAFLEIDTPIAVVCPGTEVHLQYFETNWLDFRGHPHKLYLRSSPELHMKQALASGLDRVFQMAPCFRNGGEFSDWHQPEFTMLEWYHSGQTYRGLIDQTEELLRVTAEAMNSLTGVRPESILPKSFERIGVFEAFKRFANIDLIDQDSALASKCIAAGVLSVQPEDEFEVAYFKTLIEKIEPELAVRQGVVLMDYPPSQAALSALEGERACRFEFYLGRVELCNGFYELMGGENNRRRVREAIAERERIGLGRVPEDESFYAAMDALTTPFAGNALGFDRWLAILCGDQNLDAVLPFRRGGVFG